MQAVQWGREDLLGANPLSNCGVVTPPRQKPCLGCKLKDLAEMRRLSHLHFCRVFPCTSHPLQGLGPCSEQLCQIEQYAPGTKSGFHLVGRCLWYVAKMVFYCKLPVWAASETTQISPWEHGCASKLQSRDPIAILSPQCIQAARPLVMPCAVTWVSFFSYPRRVFYLSVLLCLQCYCSCLTAGKLGCRQAILPRACRKLMKIKDSIQHPDKHLKYFCFFSLLLLITTAHVPFLTNSPIPIANLDLAGDYFSKTFGILP